MVKEFGRETNKKLPYSFIPDQITVYIVYFVIMWLNALPDENIISLEYLAR